MKRIVTVLVAVFFAANLFATTLPTWAEQVKDEPIVQTLTPEMLQQGLDEFLAMTPKKYRKLTGERLGVKKSIELKAAQHLVKKKLKKGGGFGDGPYSQVAALLLCFFLGTLGIHRLYLGYSNWWLQLITLGGCGIWSLIDLIRIIVGDMGPADGSAYDTTL